MSNGYVLEIRRPIIYRNVTIDLESHILTLVFENRDGTKFDIKITCDMAVGLADALNAALESEYHCATH